MDQVELTLYWNSERFIKVVYRVREASECERILIQKLRLPRRILELIAKVR